MSKRIFTATIFTVFAMGLVLMPFCAQQAQAGMLSLHHLPTIAVGEA